MNRTTALSAMTILLALSIRDAHAYFDPGTGSIILQAVIAAIAAVSIGLRTFWSQLKAFFSRNRSAVDSASGTEKD